MENNEVKKICAFCGKPNTAVKIMISSNKNSDIYICDRCSKIVGYTVSKYEKQMQQAVGEAFETATAEENIDEIDTFDKTPQDIYNILNESVIGQDKAKKTLAVAIYNHHKRLHDETGLIQKSNILMAGPSGSGKTLLAQTLAEIMDVPFVVVDATSITEAGYVGANVEDILMKLFQKADGNIKKVESGIVYIDEIDKIAKTGSKGSGQRDVKGEGVQQALLKMVEGSEVTLRVSTSAHVIRNVTINTKNILFICGGAFEGMLKEEIKNAFGFNSKDENIGTTTLSQEVLQEFGMIAEIIGRLPILVQLNELTEDELVRILTEPKHALVKEYVELLRQDGVELVFEEDALREIAKLAINREIGARGLRSIMEDVMEDIMFTIPSDDTITRCIVTKESVETKEPVLEHGTREVVMN